MAAQRSISSASSDVRSRSCKKAAKAKAKGAPRAKSGCYTCRIRRKRCDEDTGDVGCCKTCRRLRLQCLGFGDKRPAWLKNNTKETRNRIKDFLTQQGLVKGQTTAANGRIREEIHILVLEPATEPSSSGESSPTPSLSLSLSSDDGLQLTVSSVRDDVSPTQYVTYSESLSSPVMELVATTSDFPVAGSSTAICSNGYEAASMELQLPNPALQSGFGAHYYPDTLEDDYSTNFIPSYLFPLGNDMAQFIDEPWQHNTLKHYLDHVVQIEYLMADKQVFRVIWEAMQQSKTARDGACLLSQVHVYAMNRPPGSLVPWLETQAAGLLSKQGCEDESDAFASLQVVSAFLFAGGRGQWQRYLDLSAGWVERLFKTSHYSPDQTLQSRTELERFVIKTTIWFDVLGSVTKGQAPRLLPLFRKLFHSASIDDGASTSSMIPIMGCEREIVLALGEISALAMWKANEERHGRLSNPRLVVVGQEIENKYLGPPALAPYALYPLPAAEDSAATCRALTSAVFRASARAYLHSVLSGDAPACPEIAAAVTETVEALGRVPKDPIAERSVVRMVVFSICLAGCLTDNLEQRQFLLDRLQAQQGDGVGNCAEVRNVMETVWARRAAANGELVSWRQVMAESPEGLLLLV